MEDQQGSSPNKKETDMEPLNEFDQNHFYESDHIDSAAFAENNRSNEDLTYQEIGGTASLADRIADEKELEKKAIHPTHPRPSNAQPTKEDGEKLMDVGRAPDS